MTIICDVDENNEKKTVPKGSKYFRVFNIVIGIWTLFFFVSSFFSTNFTSEEMNLMENEPKIVHNIQTEIGYWMKDQEFQNFMKPKRDLTEFNKMNQTEIRNVMKLYGMYSKDKNNSKKALEVLEEAHRSFPLSDEVVANIGGFYFDRKDWPKAIEWFSKAHYMNDTDLRWINNILVSFSKMEDRKEEYGNWLWKSYQLDKKMKTLSKMWDVVTKFNLFDQFPRTYTEIITESQKFFDNGTGPPFTCFSALHMPFNVSQLFLIAKKESDELILKAKKTKMDLPKPKWDSTRKLRIGFVSPDVKNHAVGIQIRMMFSMFDKEKFETTMFSCRNDTDNSWVSNKIRNTVDHFVEVYEGSTSEVARIVNSRQIDILVDLAMWTGHSRIDVFAMRPSPIQVAWLGMAGTTGSPFHDYLIADSTVVRPEYEEFYSEKIVYMPHSYHIFDHKQFMPVPPSRMQLERKNFVTDLPADVHRPPFLFCNHAHSSRLDPFLFHRWMEILRRVPNSALVLKYHGEEQMRNILKYAESAFPRMKFEGDLDREWPRILFQRGGKDHIAMKSICDIYLDIPKFNGHSTTGDMLWAGVPAITQPLTTIASRAASSFVTVSGLQEMAVARDDKDYIEKAVYWGNNRKELEEIRKRLEAGREDNPLFDTFLFVKHMESAFEEMAHIEYVERERPRNIQVKNRMEEEGSKARREREKTRE
eukprot:TRINITY_DN7501_c0_g1_i1.p1 TRINITY_DN7501_c0_g1~~TRINITY_DN7501_c0_g1_i1.p1  ORF type:complete len:702 (-),score=196.91 TRINITY_DN7501_c0_g1_i1:9-2114(-)